MPILAARVPRAVHRFTETPNSSGALVFPISYLFRRFRLNRKNSKPVLVLCLTTALGACSLTATERTALTGGAIGAAAGAGIAAVASGPVVAGALIGGAAGATSGALYEVRKRRWRRRR